MLWLPLEEVGVEEEVEVAEEVVEEQGEVLKEVKMMSLLHCITHIGISISGQLSDQR